MTTDSAFRQMAHALVAEWLRPVPGRTPISMGERTKAELTNSIETALGAAWAQGRDAAADVADAVIAANDKPSYAGSVTRSVAGKIARRIRALTPAAVPEKENG